MATGRDVFPSSRNVERRIPLSRLDTHRDQQISWRTEQDAGKASETLERLSGAFSTLIECVGEHPEREGLKRTPIRAAKALCFFTKGYEDNLSSTFQSLCGGTPCTVYTRVL